MAPKTRRCGFGARPSCLTLTGDAVVVCIADASTAAARTAEVDGPYPERVSSLFVVVVIFDRREESFTLLSLGTNSALALLIDRALGFRVGTQLQQHQQRQSQGG